VESEALPNPQANSVRRWADYYIGIDEVSQPDGAIRRSWLSSLRLRRQLH
jgi:hypothetical protein